MARRRNAAEGGPCELPPWRSGKQVAVPLDQSSEDAFGLDLAAVVRAGVLPGLPGGRESLCKVRGRVRELAVDRVESRAPLGGRKPVRRAHNSAEISGYASRFTVSHGDSDSTGAW